MLIRDTQEYKELLQLQELHDSYKKHVMLKDHRYGTFICQGCGLPVDQHTGQVEQRIASYICGGYYEANDRRKLQNIKPAVFARAMEQEISSEHPGGTLINYRLLELKDQLPLAEYKAALLRSDAVDAKELYLYATKIECAPCADIYATMVKKLEPVANGGRYQAQQVSDAIMAWHYKFGTKPSKDIFKRVVTKLPSQDARPLWSRLAGERLAVSYRYKTTRGAIYAYMLVREFEPKLFNNIDWMAEHFKATPTVVLMYYQATGRLIADVQGADAAVKSKLIDKLAAPLPEDRARIGDDVFNMVYGSRLQRLSNIGGISDTVWRLIYSETYDEFLAADENYRPGDELKYEYTADGERGFAEPDPLEVADDITA